VLLVHPGGPFWAKKDERSWSIPKGGLEENEDPLTAAMREFEEETGFAVAGSPIPLEPLRQLSGKVVYAWAMKGDLDPRAIDNGRIPCDISIKDLMRRKLRTTQDYGEYCRKRYKATRLHRI